MARSPKINVDIGMVARELESARIKDGTAGFRDHRFDDLLLILATAVELNSEFTEAARHSICRQAVFDLAKKGEIDARRLLSEVARKGANFGARAKVPYVVVTSMSTPFRDMPKSVRYGGAICTFSAGRPRGFDMEHVKSSRSVNLPSAVDRFACVRIRVSARTPEEALSTALDRFDLLRGMWNFTLRRGLWHEIADDNVPINRLTQGPVQTVHHVDGSRAVDWFFHDSGYPHNPRIHRLRSGEWSKMRGEESKMRRIVDRCSFGNDIKDVLVRYCRALDSRDQQVAFLQLWAVLERLTDTVGDRYAVTIDRAAYLYSDPEMERALLECLRKYRNDAVHHGVNSMQRRYHVVLLHRCVATALEFALRSSRFFSGFPEMGRFLSLPSSRESLQRAIKLRRQALVFKRHRPQR